MTQFLPPNLLALFAARDPIPYLPPAAKLPHEKKQKGYDGVGAFLNIFEVSFPLAFFDTTAFLCKMSPISACVKLRYCTVVNFNLYE